MINSEGKINGAMNKKIIIGIVAFIFLSLIGFVYFNKIQSSQNIFNKNTQTTTNDSINTCPFYTDIAFPKEYLPSISNEAMVTYPPVLIPFNTEITPLKEKFDPYAPPFEKDFYTTTKNSYPWTERKFDVDNDNIDEQILSANTAMNHTPNLALIVKEGYTIFKAEGANISIEKAGDNNGFFLNQSVDWNIGEYKTTRYLYKDNIFFPIWYQTSCVVRQKGV